MSTVLRPTLSRWGRSVYEQAHHIASEKKLLAQWVEVVEDHQDAEIVVVHSKQPVGEQELSSKPSVKMVVTTTSGFDHLDWLWMKDNGILPVRMPMLRRDAVVESILSMLLHANRRQWKFQVDAMNNQWTRSKLAEYAPLRIQDQRIAVIGLGVIGRRLCTVLQGLGANVVGVDPFVDSNTVSVPLVELEDVPQCSDVTLLTCTLNPTSQNMINDEWLKRCDEMTLINCARGKLVNFTAAIQALSEGRLSFLGLDVFPFEPFEELNHSRHHGNLIFTPHAAGYHSHLGEQIQQGLAHIVSQWVTNQEIPHIVESPCF